MSADNAGCVIVGAGQAGAQVALSLRQGGYTDPVTLVGAEPLLPYQRPPLSKSYLKGELTEQQLPFRPQALFDKLGVGLRLGEQVASVDARERSVILNGGDVLPYEHLVLATGARPRSLGLAGADPERVCVLRSLQDADKLRPKLTQGSRLVVVGAGYIGLEVASVAARMGVRVTVLETAERVLERVAGADVAAFITDKHRAAGVEIVTGVMVTEIRNNSADLPMDVVSSDGRSWAADVVIEAVGVIPETGLAEQAGLACSNGITVDEFGCSSDPHIYAVGDCSNHPNAIYDRRLRLESVNNAVEQGKAASASILGEPRPYRQIPWFWSDQYDIKLQTVGLFSGHVGVRLLGDPGSGSFAVLYLDAGNRVIAVDAVNAPREFSFARSLMSRAAETGSFPVVESWDSAALTTTR